MTCSEIIWFVSTPEPPPAYLSNAYFAYENPTLFADKIRLIYILIRRNNPIDFYAYKAQCVFGYPYYE